MSGSVSGERKISPHHLEIFLDNMVPMLHTNFHFPLLHTIILDVQ